MLALLLLEAGSLLPLCRFFYIASKQQKQSARQVHGALNLINVLSTNKIMPHGRTEGRWLCSLSSKSADRQ
jgi:hypothetical protein